MKKSKKVHNDSKENSSNSTKSDKVIDKIVNDFKKLKSITYNSIEELIPDSIKDFDILNKIIKELKKNNIKIEDSIDSKIENNIELKTDEEFYENKKKFKNQSLDFYFRNIGKVELLTREQEIALYKSIKESRNKIFSIFKNFGFISLEFIKIIEQIESGDVRVDKLMPTNNDVSSNVKIKLSKIKIDIKNISDDLSKSYESYKESNSNSSKKVSNKIKKLNDLFNQYSNFFFRKELINNLLNVSETYAQKAKMLISARQENNGNSYDLDVKIKSFEKSCWMELDYFLISIKKLIDEIDIFENRIEEIINSNMRLVVSISKKYSDRGVPLMDLVQEGNIGLIKAIDRFDYKLGYKFSTYATWWIRQSLNNSIIYQSKTIRIPSHLNSTLSKIEHIKNSLTQEKGEEVTNLELSKELKIPIERIEYFSQLKKNPLSIHDSKLDDSNRILEDVIEDKNAENPSKSVSEYFIKDKINETLSILSDRERKIIEKRFGLVDGNAKTLNEIGIEFNLTRERVRQIESKALKKISHPSRLKELSELNEELLSDDI